MITNILPVQNKQNCTGVWVADLLRAVVVLDLVPGRLAVEGGAAEELHRVRPAHPREARVTHVGLGHAYFGGSKTLGYLDILDI